MVGAETTVLLVDDDPQVLEIYAKMLDPVYDVRKASSGERGLEAMDGAVDVVLLDRRMPGMTGDEVLDDLRAAGYGCPVVMVTAVEPDVEIVPMAFDDYLTKPVSEDDLREAIERAITLRDEDERVRDYFALVAKRDALADRRGPDDVEDDPAYQELQARIAYLSGRLDPSTDAVEELLDDTWRRLESDGRPSASPDG